MAKASQNEQEEEQKEKDIFDTYIDGLTIQQMAYDFLSIPAMSAETERVFSGTKLTISEKRSCLGPLIIEAIECSGRWMQAGIGTNVAELYKYLDGTEIREEALWGPRERPDGVEDF